MRYECPVPIFHYFRFRVFVNITIWYRITLDSGAAKVTIGALDKMFTFSITRNALASRRARHIRFL